MVRQRPFGNTGFDVSEIGFGCSRLGGIMAQGGGAEEIDRALHQAHDAGITLFDTADMYSQGESEALLGRAFKDRRDRVIIATKGGYCLPAQRKLMARIKPLVRPLVRALGIKRESLPAGVSGSVSQNFDPDYLTQALDASLKRLRTDYIDIYQVHSPPPNVIERGEFVETLRSFQRQGKIRCWGVAADSSADAALALRHDGIGSLEMPFGLLDLEALGDAFPAAATSGVGVIARGCYGGGLLKDSLTEADLRAQTPKADRILAYRRVAGELGRPLLEVALHFVLRQPAVSTTLLGMRTPGHVTDNLRLLSARPLTDSELDSVSNFSCTPERVAQPSAA